MISRLIVPFALKSLQKSTYEAVASSISMIPAVFALTLPYPEHLSATSGADALSCRLSILHGYGLSVLHFPFGLAFHTVCLH